jgi:outer membrane protein TolC
MYVCILGRGFLMAYCKQQNFLRLAGAFVLAAGCLAGQAMTSSPGAAGSSRAVQLPASGRTGQAGSVEAQQSASPGSGVATVNSSIQVTGNYAGSVPTSNPPAGPVRLSLAGALKLGMKANLASISAGNSVRASRAEQIQALSALLPNISANASETVTQVNLAAYGFQFKLPPGLNFSIPSVVGPFSYSQLQGTLSQSIYDPVQRRNWKASKESERASILSAKDARELIALAVGGTYLQTLAAAARVESQRAQVDNAQAVYNQAVVRKTAGTNSKIDVMRSLVELQTQQQRLSSLQADLQKQQIALARVIGLPQDRELILAEPLTAHDAAIPDASSAIEQANRRRADLQSAEAQVKAAEQALSAAHAERLPSVSVNGDYGVLGPNPANNHGVFAVTGSVNVPIWQGGRTRGDIQQAETTLHERQAELADQRARVEQEIRNALIEVQTASGQVHLAESNRGYASETLAESRDRFTAGVATTVEVVQAQEQVASAESDYISSLFSFDLARLSLARATGEAEADLPTLLEGRRP